MSETCRFKSMPNFRQLVSSRIPDDMCESENQRTKEGRSLKLFRSSRPDHLTAEEVDEFMHLNIRSVIDLRSASEYCKSDGPKLLDSFYPVCKVKLPYVVHADDKVTALRIKAEADENCLLAKQDELKHYLIDFFRINYVWATFTRAPWYFCLYSILVLIVDLFLRNGFKNFVRVFTQRVVNKGGLIGQYIDMLTYSQASICSALKLLSYPENVPAMINCRAGKDRTGVITALVLCCVGWSKDDIIADYVRSEIELEPIYDQIYEEMVSHFHMTPSFTTARADTMQMMFDYIEDRHGSVQQYLESIGFTLGDQQRLRQNLCDDDDCTETNEN